LFSLAEFEIMSCNNLFIIIIFFFQKSIQLYGVKWNEFAGIVFAVSSAANQSIKNLFIILHQNNNKTTL